MGETLLITKAPCKVTYYCGCGDNHVLVEARYERCGRVEVPPAVCVAGVGADMAVAEYDNGYRTMLWK